MQINFFVQIYAEIDQDNEENAYESVQKDLESFLFLFRNQPKNGIQPIMALLFYADGSPNHAGPNKDIPGKFFGPVERIIHDITENYLKENSRHHNDRKENTQDDLHFINGLIDPLKKAIRIYGSPSLISIPFPTIHARVGRFFVGLFPIL